MECEARSGFSSLVDVTLERNLRSQTDEEMDVSDLEQLTKDMVTLFEDSKK